MDRLDFGAFGDAVERQEVADELAQRVQQWPRGEAVGSLLAYPEDEIDDVPVTCIFVAKRMSAICHPHLFIQGERLAYLSTVSRTEKEILEVRAE